MIRVGDFKNDFYLKEMHCDKSFDFKAELKNCLRNFLGNCLCKEVNSWLEADGVSLKIDTPQFIIDLVEGVEYVNDNSCCGCECSNCDTYVWRGLRGLATLCIRYKYLCTIDAMTIQQVDKQRGVMTTQQAPLFKERIDTYNQIAVWNNIGTDDYSSLHRFIEDHDYPTFKGVHYKLQNYLNL